MSRDPKAKDHAGPDSEPDRLLDHNYDGIQEYDNPMPRWWLWIFGATIAFSAIYALNVPGIGIGKGRIANYERDMAVARARQDSMAAATPSLGDADLIAISKDPVMIADGKATYLMQCSPCHRPDAGGSIGPNLTDEYWIHGARPSEILLTVSTGVLDKGMPAWNQVLKPDQVSAVVGYLLTLHGTEPPNPKAPQGGRTGDDSTEVETRTGAGVSP